MIFLDSVIICFQKYFVFKGRSSRPEYWYFTLYNSIVTAIMFCAKAFDANILFTVTVVYSLIALMPTLAVTARRFHDLDISGWFCLLFLATSIPFVGILFLIPLWFMMAKKGTEGENRFGMPPES